MSTATTETVEQLSIPAVDVDPSNRNAEATRGWISDTEPAVNELRRGLDSVYRLSLIDTDAGR